jgi:hypothetical protein
MPAAAIFVGWMTMNNTQLRDELDNRSDQINSLTAEVQRLETRLVPFTTIAVERFGGNEEQALAKLAAQLEDLQNQLQRAQGMIRRFGVVAVATISGDWAAPSPPDYSNYLSFGAGSGWGVKVQLKANTAPMRWVEFKEPLAFRSSEGDNGSWVLEVTGEAAADSWVLGIHPNDLQTSCGEVEMVALGIKPGVTTDNIITLRAITLLFHVNGVPSLRCEYTANTAAKIAEDVKPPIIIRQKGPVTLERIP